MNSPISYKKFLAHCKKDISRTRVYYTYVYHQVTYPLSYLLYRLGFTANVISILGIMISVMGGTLIFMGYPVLGTALFLLSYLLDCCDGNVARIHYGYEKRPRGNTLLLGMLLENFYPNVSYPLFFISLGTHLFSETGLISFLWLAVLAGVVKLVNRYTVLHASHLNKARVKEGDSSTNKEIYSQGLLNELKYFIVRVVDSARLYYVVFGGVLIFAPELFPSVFMGYMALIVVLNMVKIFLTLRYRIS